MVQIVSHVDFGVFGSSKLSLESILEKNSAFVVGMEGNVSGWLSRRIVVIAGEHGHWYNSYGRSEFPAEMKSTSFVPTQ